MINIKMQTKDVHSLAPEIKVIGVGGAGGNAVNNMISSGLEGCEFIVCNTDAQALDGSLCDTRVQLGATVTGGLGAGSKPEVGKAAAEETLDEVMAMLEGANMAFVTAGMGGGTGTGAAPIIAKACRDQGILTVGVVTKPFHFEGSHRMRSAEAGIEEMQKYVDTLIVIPNQNLFRIANEKTTFAEAFRMADGVLQSGVRGVTDLMVRPGLVNLDFADIRTAMMEMGKAMMGTGEAEGEKRALEAAEAAINNPLLDDVSMKGAYGVIINVTGGYDMTLFEADEAANRIRDEVDPNANIIFGATFDESLDGVMRVSIVATGIEREAETKARNDSQSGGGSTGMIGGSSDNRAKLGLSETKVARSLTAPAHNSFIQSGNNANAELNKQGAPAPSLGSILAKPVSAGAASIPSFIPASKKTLTPDYAGLKAASRIAVEKADNIVPKDAPTTPRDTGIDMFEQGEFAIPSEDEKSALPENTAMRGTRYKNAFIPPRPIEPEKQDISVNYGQAAEERSASYAPTFSAKAPHSAAGYNANQVTGSNIAATPRATIKPPTPSHHLNAPGLRLNPPKLPSQENRKHTPSLFERITGSVQQRIGGLRDDSSNRQRVEPTEISSDHDQNDRQSPSSAPMRPSQGRLSIDGPAKPSSDDSDLDIPAFLRRQAN